MLDDYQRLCARKMPEHIEQMNRIERAELRLARQISEAQELENAIKRWQAQNRRNLLKTEQTND